MIIPLSSDSLGDKTSRTAGHSLEPYLILSCPGKPPSLCIVIPRWLFG